MRPSGLAAPHTPLDLGCTLVTRTGIGVSKAKRKGRECGIFPVGKSSVAEWFCEIYTTGKTVGILVFLRFRLQVRTRARRPVDAARQILQRRGHDVFATVNWKKTLATRAPCCAVCNGHIASHESCDTARGARSAEVDATRKAVPAPGNPRRSSHSRR